MNIQNQMKELFGNSCYAYCIAYKWGQTSDIKKLTKYVLDGWYKGFIDDDGYVTKPIDFIRSVDGEYYCRDIEKVYINSLDELPSGIQIVEYKKNPKSKDSHFVVVENGKVIFDPSGESQTVKIGSPYSYRKYLTYKNRLLG